MFWDEQGLAPQGYFVLTLHRPVNVDGAMAFAKLLQAVGEGTRGIPVVFPARPRTGKTLQALKGLPVKVLFVEPQPYLEFNYLVSHSKAAITDSGCITEKTTVMGVPCMVLRDTTERPEALAVGTNELFGTDLAALKPALDSLFAGRWKQGGIPDRWDGRTSERIVLALELLLAA